MNHISILIADDDLIKISSVIKTVQEVYKETLSISQASCVQEAIENLQKKEFHLLITDLQMPLKYDDTPNDKGGEVLIKSLYRKKTQANVPIYIVGLTQFQELSKEFNSVWKVWHYEPSDEAWRVNLRDLIGHISRIKSRIMVNKIETIFVEGPTDKKILEVTIKNYFSENLDKVYIDTINYGGGASWVERQLFIWAKSLTKNIDGDGYLKAIGILDSDNAGLKAINNLRNLINVNSAEGQTFSILKNCSKYSTILKSIKSKGLTFPTTLEDLISIECWKSAQEFNWFIDRDINNFIIDNSILSIDNKGINKSSLLKEGFTENEILLITKKVNDDFKKQFCNFACEYDKDGLLSIKYLIEESFEKLKIRLPIAI